MCYLWIKKIFRNDFVYSLGACKQLKPFEKVGSELYAYTQIRCVKFKGWETIKQNRKFFDFQAFVYKVQELELNVWFIMH